MADVPNRAEYRQTMKGLEAAKRLSHSGVEFWFAREIQWVFGYESWAKFTPVIERAVASMRANEIDPSHHFVQTDKMVEVGSGAKRRTEDFFLSRGACYLIAMNGDPSKVEIAAAQAYFASTTRAAETAVARSDDEKRVEMRAKVTASFKKVSGAAHKAGVSTRGQAFFHDARYHGLYLMSRRDLMGRRGLATSEQPFDRMGALELSANDFQMNLAAETLADEGLEGEARAIEKNRLNSR